MSTNPESFPYTYDGLVNWSPKLRSHSLVWRPIPQGRHGEIGIEVQGPDGPSDADTIHCQITHDPDFDAAETDDISIPPEGEVIATFDNDEIVRQGLGIYVIRLTPAHTQERGNVTATWTYSVGGVESSFVDHLRITEYMPVYHSLNDWEQGTVDTVMFMLGDLFDSTDGGPNLQETYQAKFGPERVAQLMKVAVARMNTIGFPVTSFDIGTGQQVHKNLRGVLTIGVYIEVLRHLIRSYVEQPEFRNQQVNYTDRRDYMNRWQSVLQDELRDYDKSVRMAKRSLLNLGGGSLLVSGGIYGRGGSRFKGVYGMQARSARFWPSAPVVASSVRG